MEAIQQDREIDNAAVVVDETISYRDSQVKGRVVTTMEAVKIQRGYGVQWPGFEVKQVIDGVVTFVLSYRSRLEAAMDFAMLRSHARRNLHEYLSSVRPESTFNRE